LTQHIAELETLIAAEGPDRRIILNPKMTLTVERKDTHVSK